MPNYNNISEFEAKVELVEKDVYYNEFKDIINLHKIFVNKIDYIPINESYFVREGVKILNLYKVNNIFENVKPNKEAKFPIIKEFMMNIWGGNKKIYNKFLEVCAWKIQNPEDMIAQANFIIKDDGGTGKSELLTDYILSKIFNVESITQADLEGNYNDYMVNNQWIIVEEVEGFKDAKKIKNLTGAKKLRINPKFERNFVTKNYSNTIIFSNERKPITIDENDRRFNVGGGGLRLSSTPEVPWSECYFKSKEENQLFFKKFNNQNYLKKELKELYSYLISLNVDRATVQTLVSTKQRRELIEDNKASYKLLIDDIINDKLDEVIKHCYNDSRDFIKDIIIHIDNGINQGYWISFHKLYDLYKRYHSEYMNSTYRIIAKKSFRSYLISYKPFKEIFSEFETITKEGENFKAFKIKTYIDENNDIKPEFINLE